MDDFLFAYGTLRDPDVQSAVVGRTLESDPDVLDDFTRAEITLGGIVYSIIHECAGESVEGLRLRIRPEDLERMDRYESNDYRRTRVTLRSGHSAWVYQR